MRSNFQIWVNAVCEQVRFRPDHRSIEFELRDHYEEHVRDLLRLGRPRELAEERALEAMGNAQELGRALDRVHKPWLGWLWKASRTLLLALVLLTLAAALQNEDFREICSQTSMKVQFGSPPADRWLKNHNKLLESFDGCIGVKTGFTKLSGRCLVSAAERDGVAICCVTLKDPDDWLDHQKLLEWGFGQVEKVDLQADLSAVKVPVTGGVLKGVSVRQAEAASVVVPAGSGQFTQTLYLPQFAYAPVRAGDTLGEVRWYTGEGAERRLAASAPLIAEETSEIDPTLETPWRKRFFLWKLFS